MPKIDSGKTQVRTTTVYPDEFKDICQGREKAALGNVVGLTQFGVNLTRLKPGAASALRHWHENEDEFVYVLEGELVLIENEGEKKFSVFSVFPVYFHFSFTNSRSQRNERVKSDFLSAFLLFFDLSFLKSNEQLENLSSGNWYFSIFIICPPFIF